MAHKSQNEPTRRLLPGPVTAGQEEPVLDALISQFKKGVIEAHLLDAQGNRSKAARTLGIERRSLLRLIQRLKISTPPRAIGPRPTA
jgi:DNA-binding NtrC family response regulator